MANPEHLAKLIEGAYFFDDWRKTHPDIRVDLSNADFTGPEFRWRLSQINLRGAILRGARFFISEDRGANLVNTDLREADLREVVLKRADLTGAVLSKVDLRGANLSGVNGREVRMNEANLEGACLKWTNLAGADLSGAKLWKANLRHARLDSANLTRADLRLADLMRAQLGEANLNSANLRFAILSKAYLCGADLRSAHLDQADLSDANLTGAAMFRTGLAQADLSRAILTGADLRAASLLQAKLNECVLNDAMLWETQRTGWEITGIICKRAFWDKNAQESISYEPGEFEKLYAEQTCVELFYPGGVSKFELNTLPSLLHHLASLHRETNIRLKSIEETGGGAKISISVADADTETVEAIRSDAMEVHRAQLALRDNEILRLETEKKYLESFVSERLIKAMLTATTQQNVFNAPVYGVALSSGTFERCGQPDCQRYRRPACAAGQDHRATAGSGLASS